VDSDEVSAILSVFSYAWSPPTWVLRQRGKYIEMIDPNASFIGPREGLWCPSGAVFWSTTKQFFEEPTFYPQRLSGFIMPWHRALDIDTVTDYEAALCIAYARERGFSFSDDHSASNQ
jgi:CMP-N-acetylneuraminic acid synthetase